MGAAFFAPATWGFTGPVGHLVDVGVNGVVGDVTFSLARHG